jgi:riboflavin kinase / FMN adenylyltransferase
MQHIHSLDDVQLQDVWLTIGSFDGVHRGHQEIIRTLTAGAQLTGLPAVVLTFFPHPAAILRGQNYPYYLTSPDEKAAILGNLGIDTVITHPFNRQVANTSARKFVRNLHDHLTIQHLQVGYDFALGKNRKGNFDKLKEISTKLGFSVAQTPPIEDGNGIISSSRTRFLLGVGQVEEAAALMGRNFTVQGLVEVGDQRGRTIGFPTANLSVWAEKIIPTAGVYACRANIQGQTYGAVTNIGVRPTFESKPVPPRVEAHIFDFSADIYGQNVELEFVARLRSEQRFSSVDELVAQIHKDSEAAQKILIA